MTKELDPQFRAFIEDLLRRKDHEVIEEQVADFLEKVVFSNINLLPIIDENSVRQGTQEWIEDRDVGTEEVDHILTDAVWLLAGYAVRARDMRLFRAAEELLKVVDDFTNVEFKGLEGVLEDYKSR